LPGYTPPLWGGDAYLLGAFVYVEAALFTVFGPDVRIALILNAGLATVTALFAYAGASRLFSHTAAVVAFIAVAFFPSLLLWSALNLKDSLTIALAVLAIWAAIEYRAVRRPFLALLPFAAAEILVTLRSYTAATVAIACLLAIALVGVPVTRRVVTIMVASFLTAIIILQSLNSVGIGIGQQLLVAFERERAAMAVGARTGFVGTPTPIPTARTSTAGTSNPTAAPSTEGPTRPAAASPADDVALAPGRTISYLPTGLAYAILAPFPFASGRLQELLTAPEMLLWYVLVIAGAITVWRQRRRWRSLAPIVLMIAGLVTLLALAEGNVGTLFRHRGMVVPFAAMLASPSILAAIQWSRRRQRKDVNGVTSV
jgi:4-amino-4-deoxy-L-arabinose transferase-like glycosyltransferase